MSSDQYCNCEQAERLLAALRKIVNVEKDYVNTTPKAKLRKSVSIARNALHENKIIQKNTEKKKKN